MSGPGGRVLLPFLPTNALRAAATSRSAQARRQAWIIVACRKMSYGTALDYALRLYVARARVLEVCAATFCFLLPLFSSHWDLLIKYSLFRKMRFERMKHLIELRGSKKKARQTIVFVKSGLQNCETEKQTKPGSLAPVAQPRASLVSRWGASDPCCAPTFGHPHHICIPYVKRQGKPWQQARAKQGTSSTAAKRANRKAHVST